MKKVSFSPLHKNDSFKILVANPEKGAVMLPHYSDKEAVFLVVTGKVEFLLGGSSQVLCANDSISIPKTIKHSFTVLEQGKCLLALDSKAKITFEKSKK